MESILLKIRKVKSGIAVYVSIPEKGYQYTRCIIRFSQSDQEEEAKAMAIYSAINAHEKIYNPLWKPISGQTTEEINSSLEKAGFKLISYYKSNYRFERG